ncbi:MAG TPA: LL-diaminopimelate aminotransferase [Candidatus Latescibacteria bacterium]|nr:LL-diaminopimelate aminotransferase [Candidatus Latescibacterota bacterium]
MFKLAERIRALPPYLFADIDRRKAEAIARGMDVIDLGVGDPVEPTPKHVIERLCEAVRDPANHRYPSYTGSMDFREAVVRWYRRKAGIELDPEAQVLTLIGAKEGLAHLPWAFVDPGDLVLVPDPGYPVYRNATVMTGGTPYPVPLLEEREFLPDISSLPEDVAKKAKLLFLNFPSNPTGAVATREFFREVVEFARRYGLIVVHDAAYSEVTYDGFVHPSFLEVPGALEVGIEVHSLSKTYNMTGWRLGWAAGNEEVLEGLGRVKTNVDSGAFQAVQFAGIAALDGPDEHVERQRAIYQERRDMVVRGLEEVGLKVFRPKAGCYVWCRVPEGYTSEGFVGRLIDEAGVVVTPGVGFGEHGEGYFRVSLTVPTGRLREAVERLKNLKLQGVL